MPDNNEENSDVMMIDAEEIMRAADEGRKRAEPRTDDTADRDGGRMLLGGFSLKLELQGSVPPDMTARWFAHEAGRITDAMRAGWVPVVMDDTDGYNVLIGENLADQGQWISKKTGRHDTGAPQISYLMMKKKELHDIDQRLKATERNATDAAIRNGTLTPNEGSQVTYHEATLENGSQFRR